MTESQQFHLPRICMQNCLPSTIWLRELCISSREVMWAKKTIKVQRPQSSLVKELRAEVEFIESQSCSVTAKLHFSLLAKDGFKCTCNLTIYPKQFT